jgi:hypothetical protein
MTYQEDFTLPTEYLEQIGEQGLSYMPELIRILGYDLALDSP